jgi:hypothetical protein
MPVTNIESLSYNDPQNLSVDKLNNNFDEIVELHGGTQGIFGPTGNRGEIGQSGEIGATVGLKATSTGHTLCDKDNAVMLEKIVVPTVRSASGLATTMSPTIPVPKAVVVAAVSAVAATVALAVTVN